MIVYSHSTLTQLDHKVTQMISDKGGVPRLGVPPFGHTECTHGTLNDGTILTTLFPQALTFARRSVLLKEHKKLYM